MQLLTSLDTNVITSYLYHTILKDTNNRALQTRGSYCTICRNNFCALLKKGTKITILEAGKISNDRTNLDSQIQ